MSDWYYMAGDEQRGPFTEDQLGGLVYNGEIQAESYVWQEGMADWQAAETARPDLFRNAGAQDPTAAIASPVYGENPIGNAPGAVASLVCGILGVLLCPPLVSPIAIVLAIKAIKIVNEDPRYDGRGMAVAGLVTGIAGVAFFALWMLGMILLQFANL